MTESNDENGYIYKSLETKPSAKPKAPYPQPKPINNFFENEKSHE